jgi:hypothetical protein
MVVEEVAELLKASARRAFAHASPTIRNEARECRRDVARVVGSANVCEDVSPSR